MKINWRYTIATTFVEGILILPQLATFYLARLLLIELSPSLLINLVIGGIILFTWTMITWSMVDMLAKQMLEETNKRNSKQGE